jgi:osmoprotectant transport system ATP-binding protein
VIQFESVSKTFRDGTTAVTNLDLTVPSRKITVIVGPSGCGKTTTLRMVNRMLEPTKGRVTWDGTPLRSLRKTKLRRQMGYVIQSGGLFPHRTVLENIGTVPGLLGWDKSKSRKRSLELLDSVGLDPKLADRYPAQLSGGQQQRVGVARALAADPLVLLMDEPFSAVDPVVRGELHEFFLGLQRRLSKTIILITHDVDEAIKLGDHVAILRVGGRLAQVGTPQQLLDEPADAFVEGFIGKDRGYRLLSFVPAARLSLDSIPVVRDASAAGDTPSLVVDADARPLGWIDRSRPTGLHPVGSTFDPETDTLRLALDAALTSPVGLAVAVNRASGRFAGVVSAQAILSQVAEVKATQQASTAQAEAGGGQAVETGDQTAAQPGVVEATAGAPADAEADPDSPGSAEASAGTADRDADDASAEAHLSGTGPGDRDLDELSTEAAAGNTGHGGRVVDDSGPGEIDADDSLVPWDSEADGDAIAAGTDQVAAGSDRLQEARTDPEPAENIGYQEGADAEPATEAPEGASTAMQVHTGESDNSDEDTIVVAGIPVGRVPHGVIDNSQDVLPDDVRESDADRAEARVR